MLKSRMSIPISCIADAIRIRLDILNFSMSMIHRIVSGAEQRVKLIAHRLTTTIDRTL